MKSKTKSIFTLLGTLILGIIIGLLISAAIVNKRINNFKQLATPEGFRNRLNEIVHPDSEQAAKLNRLMTEFRARFNRLHSDMRNEIDTMHSELSKVLTKKQMEKLENHLFRRRFKPFGRKRNGFFRRHLKMRQQNSEKIKR